jgi:hypothetical protein
MTPSISSRSLTLWGWAAIAFGVLTVFSGAKALFGPPEAQAALGQVVPWVLWFNFTAGFAYVAVGWGLAHGAPRWALQGSVALAVLTATVAVALATHIALGGAFEVRTAGAMALRLAFWSLVARQAWRPIAVR